MGRSGKIDYTEFVAATMDKRSYIQEDACWSAFRLFDADGNGVITLDELRQLLSAETLAAHILLDECLCRAWQRLGFLVRRFIFLSQRLQTGLKNSRPVQFLPTR